MVEATQARKVYLVGGGIASLASAAFLIRDGLIPAHNIYIFEQLSVNGGSLDGSGNAESGYVIRGGRMFNFSYRCTYELLSFVPSLTDPNKTVLDEIHEFNDRVKTHAQARLVEGGKKLDVSHMGFRHKDRLDLIELMVRSEASLGSRRIDACFEPSFFETNFWFMWATMFAFQPWHSAVEFKRYLHRFLHEFYRINTLAGVDRTPYNQYDSIVRPLVSWLQKQGVNFEMECSVIDLDFRQDGQKKVVEHIHFLRAGQEGSVKLGRHDLVFVTAGSMTADSNLGNMHTAPMLITGKRDSSWRLWQNIAKHSPEFGHPGVFDSRIDESKWESFTVTCHDPTFFRRMEEWTGNAPGTGALVTLKDSNWLMSVVLAYQPHFLNQPADVSVFWGYGLFVDKEGNFVKKKMSECTGKEILIELLSHLRFQDDLQRIVDTSICIPCMMPYITSQFLTRSKGDRPPVVPEQASNLAFIGQFTEVPEDVVFTVEYSVRTAQIAVYTLLGMDKQPPSIYEGQHDPRVLATALKMLLT
ncbi:oleate hydratase [Ktedonosporobacter rubrisoli]|uniref:Oleate hydratase n=1 Tax=Ktedonosporobacter rubrisoli TaxID=2509675 RepID=A0A4P6JQS0_KTERU|nr:oleate hydratase [Ktedonosporobacter rubrisoli]QBD77779.1 oleate hydratase [Ktedonosporobacter rubrisoli]